MTPEQATIVTELLSAHLNWWGIWEGFAAGLGLSGGLLVYRMARKTVEEHDE